MKGNRVQLSLQLQRAPDTPLITPVANPHRNQTPKSNASQALLRELLIHAEDRMPSMAGPEFAYIIAALAKLKSGPDVAWLNRWVLMGVCDQFYSGVALQKLPPS